jgi:cyclohexadieny/prephenate dehydrogenase
MKPGATLTDVGSTKANVAEAFRPTLPLAQGLRHPRPPDRRHRAVGPDAGFAELFENRWTILTPAERTTRPTPPPSPSCRPSGGRSGAQVELMDDKHHDLVLAVVSHLPHLIAYTIVGSAADLENVTESEVIKFSASGFRDFTRIAASDPTMWRDIFVANKDAVLEMLGRFTEDLQAMSRAIRWGDADTLHAHFTRTRAIRRGIVAAGQESAEPNFGRDRTRGSDTRLGPGPDAVAREDPQGLGQERRRRHRQGRVGRRRPQGRALRQGRRRRRRQDHPRGRAEDRHVQDEGASPATDAPQTPPPADH